MRHSVVLDKGKCKGCTTCIKQCPTEAIRVRQGKATILPDRCIDCGRCISVCPHRAKRAVSDAMEALSRYRYTVALLPSSLYVQFQNLEQVPLVLDAVVALGFDEVFEIARAAEMISVYAAEHLDEIVNKPRPRISSFCPAVVRLIRMRFPRLIANIAPHVSPEELSAMLARRAAMEKTGYSAEEIGVFAVSPCPARRTAAGEPEGLTHRVLDGMFSMNDICRELLPIMQRISDEDRQMRSDVCAAGVGWALSGGESAARDAERFAAADGIENVIALLEAVEDGRLPDVDFLELSACTVGCVGGCLTVENPFVARMRMKQLMKTLPPRQEGIALPPEDEKLIFWNKTPQHIPVLRLDQDRNAAMEKLLRIEELAHGLPGLDCGSCGAPNCHALAEDIVRGIATEDYCIFKAQARAQERAGVGGTDAYLPLPFRRGAQASP